MVGMKSALKTIANKLINLHNKKLDIATMQAIYGTRVTLTSTYTMATGWTYKERGAYLFGDKLVIYFNVSRSSSYGSGNIDNENMITLKINTEGRISEAHATTVNAGNYGQLVSMTATPTLSGSGSSQVLSVTIKLNASHAGGQQIANNFFLPVRINPAYYGLT